ncbi:MAG TPA: glycerate kinase [Nocardioidaceae bacterium]
MRVVIAPDKFAGTLTAVEAAQAIADGWLRRAPGDEVELVPMADGGPGFVDVLHASLGGDLLARTVTGPCGETVPASLLLVDGTAYVESAQACGLHLTRPQERDPERATTRGVGELVAAAVDAGARHVVVGLGGSGTNDGGAGLLAALGADAVPGGALEGGPSALSSLERVDLAPARHRLEGVTLTVASDVDNPLLGLIGATNVYGPQKGLAQDRLLAVDAMLETLAAATDKRTALAKGAGAAGGLGFALLLLGATRQPGVELVADAVGLERKAAAADLVVTGEGAFDFSSRSGKVPYGVAAVAARVLVPCIALAGKVLVGSREMRALGIESAYAVVDLVGEEKSFSDPAGSLAALAERVARTWSYGSGSGPRS